MRGAEGKGKMEIEVKRQRQTKELWKSAYQNVVTIISGETKTLSFLSFICAFQDFFFFFNFGFVCLFIYLFIYLFIFGCVGSSFLCEGFL